MVSIVDPYSSKNFANAESSDWNLYGVEVWACKYLTSIYINLDTIPWL